MPHQSPIIDISVTITHDMPIYDRNPGVHVELAQAIARGDSANVSALSLGAHTGTHVDAPRHFFDDGTGAEAIPLDVLIGDAYVADVRPLALREPITDAVLERAEIPADATRVLLKTHDGALWQRPFSRDFSRLDGSGARFLHARGIVCVGIDYLSIGDGDAHRELLASGIVPVEGLDLAAVDPGSYWFCCLPLKLDGTDGAPARAVLRARA